MSSKKTRTPPSPDADFSPAFRVAYRLDHRDLEHLLLGGDLRISGDRGTLVLAVDGVPVKDDGPIRNARFVASTGTRIGCTRRKSFESEDDGT